MHLKKILYSYKNVFYQMNVQIRDFFRKVGVLLCEGSDYDTLK